MSKLRKLINQSINEPLVICLDIDIYEKFNHYKTDMTITSITNLIIGQLNRIITKQSIDSDVKCLGIIKVKQRVTKIPIGELQIFKDVNNALYAVLYNDQNFNIGNTDIAVKRLELYPYFDKEKDYRWNISNNIKNEKPQFSDWAISIYDILFKSVD